MRSKVLGLATAAVAAGALTLGVPTAPAQAVAWKAVTEVPFPAGTISEIEVVSTGDGDAVAAAIIDGAVHAYTAVDGVWTGHALVRADVDATRLVLASNQSGDNAVGWVENVAGDDRLRVSRQQSQAVWSGHLLGPMTPSGADVVGLPQLGISGDGRVITAATIDGEESNHELVVTEWAKGGGSPGAPKTISAGDAWNPSLDVNSKGEALLAYNYTGLIDDVLNVSRRSAAGVWSIGDSTSNSGDLASAPDVAIAETGEGQVVYAVVATEAYMVETSRVLTNGTALNGEILSNTPEFASEPTVDMDAAGNALFAWIADKDGTTSVRHARAAVGSYPGTPQTLTGTLPDAERPIARINGGRQFVQHSGNGKVTTHYRTSALQSFAQVSTGTGYAADTGLDLDRSLNAVMVGVQSGSTQARFFDSGAPSVALTQPGSSTTVSSSVPLKWSAADSLSGLKPGTDLYLSSAAWNKSGFSAPAVVVDDAPGSERTYAAAPGATYCFQARVVDAASNAATSAKRCTTVPLDDKSLAGSGWTRAAKPGHFRGTWSATSTKGRVLTRTGVKATRLALVAARRTNGGRVEIRWNGTVIRTISLKGANANRVVFPIKTWDSVRSGNLKIKVVSANGRPVRIDGLVVAK